MPKEKPDLNPPVFDMKEFESFRAVFSQIVPFDVMFGNMTVSDYELLTQVIWLLNKVIDVTNKYTEQIDDVLEWLTNEGLQEEVIKQLNVWLADGTLEDLINETLFNKKLDKVDFEEFKVEYNAWKTIVMGQFDTQLGFINTLFDNVSNLENIKLDTILFEDFKEENEVELGKKLDKTVFEDYKVENDVNVSKKLDNHTFEVYPHDKNFALHLRVETPAMRTGDMTYKYGSLQGGCIIGNNVVMAFINSGDAQVDNRAELREYDMTSGAMLRKTMPLMLHHANGMDYNPKTNELIVANTNTQTSGSSSHNNNLTILDYATLNIKRVVSPNIPAGRRIKSYSYDKVTGKQYASDDLGFYLLDDDFKVVKSIDFDKEFTEKRIWGLGQNSSINNDTVHFLTMGKPSLVVFNIKGELINFIEFDNWSNYEDYFIGEEIQFVSFDKDDNFYLGSRYGFTEGRTTQTYANYLFKGNFDKGVVGDSRPFTKNPRTSKSIYVDPNSNDPRPDGSNVKPFKWLEEALYFALSNPYARNITIYLMNGYHQGCVYLGDGRTFNIIGQTGARLGCSRFDQTSVYFQNVVFDNSSPDEFAYNYNLRTSLGQYVFDNCEFRGAGNSGTRTGLIANPGSAITFTNTNTFRDLYRGVDPYIASIAGDSSKITGTNVTAVLRKNSATIVSAGIVWG